MDWADKPITWGKEDHPDIMPTPGGYALVLDPTIKSDKYSIRFTRCLIDGGSSINILYKDTLDKLGIREMEQLPTQTVFHGIVPGHSHSPMGKIRLEVLFGSKDNFRREPIWFEVVNLSSPYHALLGRPALAKFMAVPHYAYLKMKMPGSKGIITVSGEYKRSIECARASAKLAEALVIAEELEQIKRRVDFAKQNLEKAQRSTSESTFQPDKDARRSGWTRTIRTASSPSARDLTANRKARSSSSSVRIGTSLHGLHKTCLVF